MNALRPAHSHDPAARHARADTFAIEGGCVLCLRVELERLQAENQTLRGVDIIGETGWARVAELEREVTRLQSRLEAAMKALEMERDLRLPRLLDKHDVAKILKIDPRGVDWLIQRKKLRPRKVGARLNRWLLSDIEGFLRVSAGSLDQKMAGTRL